MHIRWNEVQLFLAIVESGSMSAAAKRLKITQPTVSRQLAELETRLGESLFRRNVEGAALTAFGERILAPAQHMAESAAELEQVASTSDSKPRGTVRVTAPPGIAYLFVAPLATQLRKVLPDVQLEVVSSVNYVDLVRREADLAIRMQPLDRPSSQRDLVCLASHEHAVAAFATREYIASLPRNYELADVGWIGWAPPLEHLPPNPQLAARIPNFRPAFASDDYIVQLRAAEAGVGAIVLARFRGRRALPSPLVELRVSFGNLTSSLHLVAARSSLTIARVKAVADVLAQELAAATPSLRRAERR